MIRRELVDEEHWVSSERFNRALAVYQVLPGPEAHELCVYFGTLARGRIGGILAGVAFMLPGFVLMFALSWGYLTFGIESIELRAVFAGFQAAVVALIVRAVHRIAGHALHDRWLLSIGAAAFMASLLGTHFGPTLLVAGVVYALAKRGFTRLAFALEVIFVAGVLLYALVIASSADMPGVATGPQSVEPGRATLAELFTSGLKAGLLTFGGAYTVIPFMQHDAVSSGGWMTNKQFLDGLALSGVLPAPLIIFSTFVGYFSGGPLGALVMTFAIFAPAFAFTLVGHRYMERLIAAPSVHAFLDGVTAGVVGLIAATAIQLFGVGVSSLSALMIFAVAVVATYVWKAKAAVAGIVLGAGILGFLLMR
jgi:chromate transporter